MVRRPCFKFRLRILLILVGWLLFPTHSTHAQSSEITFYVGGFLGDKFLMQPSFALRPVEGVFNDRVIGGIRYAYFFHPRLAMEGGVGLTPAVIATAGRGSGGTVVSTTVGVDTWVFHANLTWHIVRAPVIPYLTGGAGVVHFRLDNALDFRFPSSDTDFAPNIGGGLKIPIRDTVALRFDSRVYWAKPDFSIEGNIQFVEITGGVSILFDF